jgi:hypothetical protein
MTRIPLAVVLIVFAILASGCAGSQAQNPAPTCPPCPTCAPTALPPTAQPTYTPYPTLAPLPTYTPYPTATVLPTATPEPTPSVGTRTQPYKLGETAAIDYLGGQIELTITKIVVGKAAQDMVTQANRFNGVPTEGNEYVLFYGVVKIVKVTGDKALGITEGGFTMVDAKGELYRMGTSIVMPEPEFGGAAFAGATVEGWGLLIRSAGTTIHLVWDMESDGSGGTWFEIPGQS